MRKCCNYSIITNGHLCTLITCPSDRCFPRFFSVFLHERVAGKRRFQGDSSRNISARIVLLETLTLWSTWTQDFRYVSSALNHKSHKTKAYFRPDLLPQLRWSVSTFGEVFKFKMLIKSYFSSHHMQKYFFQWIIRKDWTDHTLFQEEPANKKRCTLPLYFH